MYVLDNLLRDKFLEDIKLFLEKYKIIDNTFLLEGIIINLTFRTNSLEIRQNFINIYKNLYQRHFAILEILSAKQQLESHRQVFNLLKDYIGIHTIQVSWPEILNLFISHKNQELIQDHNPIRLFPNTEIEEHLQHPRTTPPLYIIYRAPSTDSESEEDTEDELELEEDLEIEG